jgi:CheY-like chemotaxis protein
VTRLLCVDDNEDNIYFVKMRLEMIEGFDITVAGGNKKCPGAEGPRLSAGHSEAQRQPPVLLLGLPRAGNKAGAR